MFSAPWHAQVFALTVRLNDTGQLDWAEWAHAFGETLAHHGLGKDLDGGDDYFAAWVETLETVLIAHDQATRDDMMATKTAGTEAYLGTPHSQPVRLREPG